MMAKGAGGEDQKTLIFSVTSSGYALPRIILCKIPSGYEPDEYPRNIAYTGFIGIWRPHDLAHTKLIRQPFYRTEFIGLCDRRS